MNGALLSPEQVAEHYGDTTYYTDTFGRIPWAVHIIGPDEVHTHVNPELADDDPANEEFTQRTALKFAAESNAFAATLPADRTPVTYHCVVLHHGDPWVPDEIDGPTGVYCEWFDSAECEFFCNQCFRQLPGQAGCPEHAPTEIPGLQVAECTAEPGTHPRTFVYADNGGYGAPCMYCAYASVSEAHRGCEHSHHWAWRRWKATKRVLRGLHRLKLATGHRSSYNLLCNGCVSGISWRWSR